jgi:hypothetical protein
MIKLKDFKFEASAVFAATPASYPGKDDLVNKKQG